MREPSPISPLGPGKRRILVMCGNEAPAIAVANVYARALADHDVRFLEEQTVSPGRWLAFSWRRLRGKGPLSLLDSYAYYLHQWFAPGMPAPQQKRYSPEFVSSGFSRDARALDFINTFAPDVILIGFCGLLSAAFLHSLGKPVYNTHPGINPRYRGFGNIWAYYENNPHCVGYTIHRVDEGADTGERVAAAGVNLDGVAFERIDEHVAALAAGHLADLLLGKAEPHVPEEFARLESRYYGVPTFSAFWRARANFACYHKGDTP